MNADTVTQTTYSSIESGQTDSVTSLALLYSNSDKTSNNGVEKLTVGLICDSTISTPVYSPLVTSDNGLTYTTTQKSDVNCPIFSYGILI